MKQALSLLGLVLAVIGVGFMTYSVVADQPGFMILGFTITVMSCISLIEDKEVK